MEESFALVLPTEGSLTPPPVAVVHKQNHLYYPRAVTVKGAREVFRFKFALSCECKRERESAKIGEELWHKVVENDFAVGIVCLYNVCEAAVHFKRAADGLKWLPRI